MITALLSPRTRLLVGALTAVFVAAVPVVAALVLTGDRARESSRVPVSPVTAGQPPASDELVWRTPTTVLAPDTPVQNRTDQSFLDALARQPGMDSAATLPVPAPAVGGGWPGLPIRTTPEAWARQFTKGLLEIDYAAMSREALGPWLQAVEAPALVPGIPVAVADKMLYTSLLATEVFGGQPTPIPSPAEWEANARAAVRQQVSGLRVRIDPRWTELLATGWRPADARMAIVDVSGRLSVRRGDYVSNEPFGLQLLVGSARWRDGYGTVSVFGWEVGSA